MNFNNKTVWITGASSGIGKAMALEFFNQGANVILSARSEDKLLEVKNQCKNSEKIKVLPLDLTNANTFVEKTKEAINLFDGVDILVNNGGVSQRAYAVDTDLKVDREIFEINYFGTIALTKAILPHFMARKKGQFVVTSSIMGKIGTPLRTAYAGSKHALHGFFDCLRAELYHDHIKVTLICPGYVSTNLSKNALAANGKKFNKLDDDIANGLSPENFAKQALKAISKEKQEIVIAGVREKSAVYLKRFLPKVLSAVVKNVNVKQ